MSITLFEATIPVFLHSLTALSAILKKGETYATENSIRPSKILESRHHEDMAGLIFQVQRLSDCAKLTAVRVAKTQNVPMVDDEQTFADLQNRIQKTIDFLKNVDEASMNKAERDEIVYKMGNGKEFKFSSGANYVFRYALPNFYFHVTTTYTLLRAAGVPVGKFDYLGVGFAA